MGLVSALEPKTGTKWEVVGTNGKKWNELEYFLQGGVGKEL